MSTRSWSCGDPHWGWPDDVDSTGTGTAGGYRYLPITQTCGDGYTWTVARVHADEGDDEMLADARLISAAPDMLAALKMCVELETNWDGRVICFCDDPEIAKHGKCYMCVACDAIAKAEGRE